MTNYFDFFGLPVAPTVDQAALKKTFFANSKRFHPDFHTLSDADRQEEALEQSTRNNQGYKILRDDDLRLKHFLEIREVLGEEGSNTVPQNFLMEIMDVNEALMELEFDDDPEARKKVIALIEQLERNLEAEVSPVLAGYTADSADSAALDTLKNYYLKRRYLLRLRQKV